MGALRLGLVTGRPEQGVLVKRAKDLLDYARHQGYKSDELIRIIETLG